MAYFAWLSDGLPAGSYPLWVFVMPVAVVVGLLTAAGLGLLRMCGVPLFRQDNLDPSSEDIKNSQDRISAEPGDPADRTRD
jgi:hypothetical protein